MNFWCKAPELPNPHAVYTVELHASDGEADPEKVIMRKDRSFGERLFDPENLAGKNHASAEPDIQLPVPAARPCRVEGNVIRADGYFCATDHIQEKPVEKPESPVPPNLIDGRYELMSPLDAGGIGMAYMAYDRHAESVVALRLIFPGRSVEPRSVRRFRLEAFALSTLSHPCIAAVKGYGQDKTGWLYLATDHVQGTSVSDILQNQGFLAQPRAIQVCLRVGEGLKHAHERGIVHRDLKPSKVMLTTDADGQEQLKIVDFGITRIFDQKTSVKSPAERSSELFGNPWYRSQDQALTKPEDEHSNIFQLGCLLCELLTGSRSLNGGKSVFDEMNKQGAHAGAPGGFSGLSYIIARAVSETPASSYLSIEDMMADLRVAAQGLSTARADNDKQDIPGRALMLGAISRSICSWIKTTFFHQGKAE